MAETENSDFPRMTVVVNGDERILEQIKNQFYELEFRHQRISLKSIICIKKYRKQYFQKN